MSGSDILSLVLLDNYYEKVYKYRIFALYDILKNEEIN
jgi:hypothetical protein